MFTTRYALSPYITQIRFVFKGLKFTVYSLTKVRADCDMHSYWMCLLTVCFVSSAESYSYITAMIARLSYTPLTLTRMITGELSWWRWQTQWLLLSQNWQFNRIPVPKTEYMTMTEEIRERVLNNTSFLSSNKNMIKWTRMGRMLYRVFHDFRA